MAQPQSTTGKIRRTRSPQVRTRTAILAAAREAFFANGLSGTSMQAIADRAGVSKTTIYAQFGDKDELFRHVMHHEVTALRTPALDLGLPAGASARDRLEQMLLRAVSVTSHGDGLRLTRRLVAESLEAPRLASSTVAEIRDGVRQPVVETVEELAREHGVELEHSAEITETLLRAAIGGLLYDALLNPELSLTEAVVREYVALVVDTFLHGVREGRVVRTGPGPALRAYLAATTTWTAQPVDLSD